MEPSSRTPEGEPNHCPVCGKEVRIEPSRPPGDAPCPHCGHLLWFDPSVPEGTELPRREKCFELASKQAAKENYDYAIDLFAECVLADMGNLNYVQAFIGTLQKKYGSNKKGSVFAQFKQRADRRAVQEAIARRQWDEVIKNSLNVLKVNPWDASLLTAMATAYENIAGERDELTSSRFADCELFCLKCAVDANPDDRAAFEQLTAAMNKRRPSTEQVLRRPRGQPPGGPVG